MAEQLELDSKIVRELALKSPIDRTLAIDKSDLDRELAMKSPNDLEYFE